jgi:2,7-dihydroxy-5-methyl-1-naphthoate 7-O-methyltransferase
VGVLARDGTDRVSLTELGEQLLDRHPGRARAWLDITGAVGRGDLSAFHLLDVVRTGRPGYPLAYGREYWEDIAADAALSESLDALMGSRLRFEAPEIAAGYEWRELEHIVDVGGGNGTLLAAILAAHPALRGTLVELAGPAAAARRLLADAGVADRCEVVEGSFFDALPAGADAYLLSGVLHNWDDDHAIAILRRCAEAAGATGRVLALEHPDGAGEARTEMDLRMLVYVGGRERSLGELEQLAARAGLDLGSVHPVSRYRAVIELHAATG